MKSKSSLFKIGDKVQWRYYPLRDLSSLNTGKRKPMIITDIRKTADGIIIWLDNSVGWLNENIFMSYKEYSDKYDDLFGAV